VKSVDGGTTWSLVKYFSNTNITSIAVLSSGHIFIASGLKTIIDYDENKDSIVKYAHAYSITSVAVCEAGSDSGGVNHPTLIVGTEMGGLYVWEYGPSQSFINSTNGQKAYSTIKLVATGKKSALALAKSKSGERMLLFSLDGGFSWISTSVSTLTYQYLDAVIATNDPSAVMSDENGSVTLINGLQPTLKQTRTPIYGRKIRDVSISNGYIIAAVDSVGVMYSTDNGETWATGKKGLSKIMVTARKGGGVLMLLPSLVDGLTKDDKWLAGYIGQSGVSATNSFEMSAKVVEHYSRLELPFNTGSYNDVYEVTYTCAPNDRGVHVVHVFYAKEYGPILFQCYMGDRFFYQYYVGNE